MRPLATIRTLQFIVLLRQPKATNYYFLLTFQTTSAKSSAGAAKKSSVAHIAGGSALDGEKLYRSTSEFFPGSYRHESLALHAAASQSLSATTSVATAIASCERPQLAASCGWNIDSTEASASTTFMSSEETKIDNRRYHAEDSAAAAASASSDHSAVVIDGRESCDVSQSTNTKKQHEKDMLSTEGQELHRSQECSAFRMTNESYPLPIADTAEVNQCHSTMNTDHSQPKYSAGNLPPDELLIRSLSSCITEVSPAFTDKQSSQLQDVEPDDNNNNMQQAVGQMERLAGGQRSLQETDNTDVSTCLNSVVNCSQAPLTSDAESVDTFEVCQSKTNDNASDEQRVICTHLAYGSVSATETAVLDDGSSKPGFALNRKSSVPTRVSELDSIYQPQQPNQSSADQQQVDIHGVTTSQRREDLDEMEQFSSSSTEEISPDEHTIGTCDFDIPEVPLFQNYVMFGKCQPVNQHFAHDTGECEVSTETSGSTRLPAAETEETKGTVCSETDAGLVSVQASVTCRGNESNSEAVSAEELKDTNIDVCDLNDSDQTADAFRQAELSYRPLDLTCNRVHSTSDAQRPGEILNAADVAGQNGISQTYSNCTSMNMCNCQSSHTIFSEYHAGWSMVQATNSCNVGWPPHPYPCCGHHGVYPGPGPPMFPGLQWQFRGTRPFQNRARSRGTRPRRRPVPSSCSRVDGIRSTKVSTANGQSSQMKDVVPYTYSSSFPATGISGQDLCSSSGEVSTRPSSTSSADTIVNVPASGWKDSDLAGPYDVNSQPVAVTTSEMTAVAVSLASRSRGGRRRGRASRNSVCDQPRSAVGPQDGEGQPVVRGRKRGRPRKNRGIMAADLGSRDTGQLCGGDGGSATATAPVRSRRRRLPAAANLPACTNQATVGINRPCSTVVEQTEACGTVHFGTPAMSTPPVYASSATTRPLPGIQYIISRENNDNTGDGGGTAPINYDSLWTASMTFGNPPAVNVHNYSTPSTFTTAAHLTAEPHHHHFPLMSPPGESPAGAMLCDPIATSGAIIRKPRSRKQGCHGQSNTATTTVENSPGIDSLDEAGPAVSSVNPGGEHPVSWQPLVTESAISSLLDTLSVASSDHEMAESTLTSCDIRLQTGASTPFVSLERADLNRCAVRRFRIDIFTIVSYLGARHSMSADLYFTRVSSSFFLSFFLSFFFFFAA